MVICPSWLNAGKVRKVQLFCLPLVVGCSIATCFFLLSSFSITSCLSNPGDPSNTDILNTLEISTQAGCESSNLGHYLPESHLSVGGTESKHTFGWLSLTGASFLIFIALVFKSLHDRYLIKDNCIAARHKTSSLRLKCVFLPLEPAT